MADIYQQIWDADQSGSGVRPIAGDAQGSADTGFVRVAEGPASQDLRILSEVVIPPARMKSYDLVRALFDNYALAERSVEIETPEEREEVHDLLYSIVETAPMQVARLYVQNATGTAISTERWYATLLELWFRRFSQGGDPDLSGFEHVFVGEQEGAVVQGYHFWYKYFLDDGFASKAERERLPGFRDDRIQYLRSESEDGQAAFPESVTIAYRWDAPDYEARTLRPLVKKKGGFFVGCSAEGLMALGTVRAHLGARAPKEAVINGARYSLKLFRSADNKNIRTFYPVFLGPAGDGPWPAPVVDGGDSGGATPPPSGETVVNGPVRIMAALINPDGPDEGFERVTLLNTSSATVELAGWRILDKNRKHFEITEGRLERGAAITFVLPSGAAQLSNSGGEIRLVDPEKRTVHIVSYSKAQARRRGDTIVF